MMPFPILRFFKYVDSFVEYRRTVYDVSEETVRSNLIDLRLFQDFVKERHHKTINGSVLMSFQYYLKHDRCNSGASINRKIFTLKSYGRYLQMEQAPAADTLPFRDILKIRGGYRNRPNALTKNQIRKLFDSIDRGTMLGIRNYAVYAMMYDLGLRVGEVHRLDLTHLNLQSRQINVIGKGRRKRTLPLNSEMIRILSDWLAVRKQFLHSDTETGLFISKKGLRLSIRTMEDNWQRIVAGSGQEFLFPVVCHSLRHSFASHLNDQDVDILVIQSLLGHSSPRSTQIYIHPSEQRVRQALDNLPGVKLVSQLVSAGRLKLSFQKPFQSARK
jgi:site-specific recombinase XerD